MARLIETDSLANQNISAALAIGAYTGATIPRMVVVRVLVNQVAGGGDYIIYATLTKGGVEYRVIPTTTGTAAAALTSIAFVSIPIAVDVGDVLTVYIDGLAADTVTPDTRVDFYESGHLMPTTTDLTLDVSATGEAGLDFANIKQATAPTTLADITVPTVTTLTNYASQTIRDAMKLDASAGAPVAGSIDAHLDTLVGFGAPPAMISGLQVRDAMKLDASVGAPAAGSIDAHLDTVVGFGAPPAMIGAQAVRDAMKLDAGVGAPAAGSVDAHLDTVVGYGAPPAMIGAQAVRDAMKLDAGIGAPAAGSVDAHLDTTVGYGAPPAMIAPLAIRDAMKLAPTGGAPAADSVDAHLDTVVGFGAPPAMITQQQVRDAMKLDAGVGAAAAGSVDTHLDDIVDDTGTAGVVVAAASKTGYALSAAGVDAVLDEAVDGAYTLRQLMALVASALCGKASGGGTATVTFRNAGDTANRIVATVDANGNRTTVTLTP